MYFTVSDFYRKYKDIMVLACGGGGMARRVSHAGILDYELMPKLKGKYQHSNFLEEQLVITSFLYAHENPFLIGDAVKELITKGVSGLVIKNVFQVNLPDTVLRYADTKNFPIFITEAAGFYFEDFIYDIMTNVKRLESVDMMKQELDAIMSENINELEVYECSLNLNPSFENQHQVFYIPMDSSAPDFSYTDYCQRYLGSRIDRPDALFTLYGDGVLYIATWENDAIIPPQKIGAILKKDILHLQEPRSLGISDTHYYLGELNQSIHEAIYASLIANDDTTYYSDLGIMRILLPYCNSPIMAQFSQEIMAKLEDYDAEYSSHLAETLKAYCDAECSFPEAANVLRQHENTIRYRMDRIRKLTGLDYKKSSEMAQLDVACKIQKCRELLCKNV